MPPAAALIIAEGVLLGNPEEDEGVLNAGVDEEADEEEDGGALLGGSN